MQNNSGRLRYANPKDLPSYPTVGITDHDAASSAAASLGWANQKQFEHWKPGATSSSASTAAMLAKDYKAGPGWQPEPNSAGAQAAVLAAGSAKAALNSTSTSTRKEATDSTRHNTPSQPSSAAAASASMSNWGNSAANLAFKSSPAKKPSPSSTAAAASASASASASAATPSLPAPEAKSTGMASLERQKSLRAAKGAMAASTNRSSRPRAKSTPAAPQPPSYPDQANAAANALSAATSAHRPKTVTHRATPSGGAVPYTTMNRLMFTSHPPVKPEVDEQRRQDVIHASAVAMAKRMYTQQQRAIDAKKAQAAAAASATSGGGNGRDSPATSSDFSSQPQPYVNLQEAAYKLAQERLAKLHNEHQRDRDVQEYYGVGAGSSSTATPASPTKRGFSMRNKLRRRASSDGAVVEDRRQSERIRQQMSAFSNKLTEVDTQKRQRDRDAVLAAAQRNVRAQLEGMDRKIASDTGRPSATVLSQWELKAHAAARNRSEARVREDEGAHGGKIDIGGGKWIDPEIVQEAAARRVQPVLDEINEKAEKERERQLTLKLEEEKRKADEETRKAREKEIEEIHLQLKQEQRAKDQAIKEEVKREEKLRKEAEKAARAEQKEEIKQEKHARQEEERATKAEEKARQAEFKAEQKRQSDEAKNKDKEPAVASPSSHRARSNSAPAVDEPESTQRRLLPAFERTPQLVQTKPKSKDADADKSSPKSPSGDEATSPTSKMKTWLKSRFTRPRAKTTEQEPTSSPSGEGSFIGGAALHRRTDSLTSLENSRSASMREVALAGRSQPAHQTSGQLGRSGVDSSVSSLSGSDDDFSSARGDDKRASGGSGMAGTLSPPPPPKLAERVSGSPVGSRFLENLDS